MDNDIYGHVNNVAYYSFFDTAANRFLIERGGLDIAPRPVIGLVVESHVPVPRAARLSRSRCAPACASTSSATAR